RLLVVPLLDPRITLRPTDRLIHTLVDAVRFPMLRGGSLPAPVGDSNDPRPTARGRSPLPGASVPANRRPQTPGPAADRAAGPPPPQAPGHRRRPGHHAPHRPALAQRLPGPRPRWLTAAQGPGCHGQDPPGAGRPGAALGDGGARPAGAGPGQLDPRGAGRPPARGARPPGPP